MLFVQHNPGTRTCRLAAGLAGLGHRCDLLTRWPARLHREAFREVRTWTDVDGLVAALRALDGAHDVWHVGQYNDAEWIAPLALCARDPSRERATKVVYDCRDMRSLMPLQVLHEEHVPYFCEAIRFEELTAFRFADAVLHVSPEIEAAAKYLHHGCHPPSLVVRSCVLRSEMPALPDPASRSGMVYSGGLFLAGSGSLRDYGRVFAACARAVPGGMHVQSACLPGDPLTPEIHRQYSEAGCTVHARVPDADLPQALTRYRWGFVGFEQRFPLGVGALPNKLFECLAAGVVPVTFNCDAAARLVEEHGCGLRCTDLSRLGDLLCEENWKRCHDGVLCARELLTMEAEARRLERFYAKVCARRPRHCRQERFTLGYPLFDPFAGMPPEPPGAADVPAAAVASGA